VQIMLIRLSRIHKVRSQAPSRSNPIWPLVKRKQQINKVVFRVIDCYLEVNIIIWRKIMNLQSSVLPYDRSPIVIICVKNLVLNFVHSSSIEYIVGYYNCLFYTIYPLFQAA
jgi:hypothetical protein